MATKNQISACAPRPWESFRDHGFDAEVGRPQEVGNEGTRLAPAGGRNSNVEAASFACGSQ